ncbi:class I lanthipeptide [uncultured Alistipes sp.]|uniref:class I lanthipeptide n=1 Tax=uncultured Alistipes sp. TaxID=538949 RepID=UPI0025CE99B3|nr:class I lanthipeptide [uncultured Alistipes sp.]
MKKLQLKRDVVATLEKASMQNVKGGINVSDNSICVSNGPEKTCNLSDPANPGTCMATKDFKCNQTQLELCKTTACQTNDVIYCEIGHLSQFC